MNWSNSWGNAPINSEATTPAKQVNPEPSAFPEWDGQERDAVLMHWQELQKSFQKAKELELAFRKYVVKRAFPTPQEGMNTIDLGEGYKLKAGIKFNYKLHSDNKVVEDCLEKIAKLGNDGPFIADRLVSWTPNFLLTEYRKLQEEAEIGIGYSKDNAKKILSYVNEMLTIDDAAPTLEIKEPKAKKK